MTIGGLLDSFKMCLAGPRTKFSMGKPILTIYMFSIASLFMNLEPAPGRAGPGLGQAWASLGWAQALAGLGLGPRAGDLHNSSFM